MQKIIKVICRLLLGFMFCACSTVLALKSNLGLSPWDVFHQGVSNKTGLTIGQVNILVGITVVAITAFFKLEIGLGTIANMIIIGFFTDIIINLGVIPTSTNLFVRLLMLVASLFSMAIGSYLYIGCELGCGPRDGLMVVLVKLTGKSVALIRSFIEISVLIIGWMLGGTVGIGTLVTVFGVGICVQIVFKIFKFDVNKVKHKNIKEGFLFFNKYANN